MIVRYTNTLQPNSTPMSYTRYPQLVKIDLTVRTTTIQRMKRKLDDAMPTKIRGCSNCHQPGHYKKTCQREPVLSCSICGNFGHEKEICDFYRTLSERLATDPKWKRFTDSTTVRKYRNCYCQSDRLCSLCRYGCCHDCCMDATNMIKCIVHGTTKFPRNMCETPHENLQERIELRQRIKDIEEAYLSETTI